MCFHFSNLMQVDPWTFNIVFYRWTIWIGTTAPSTTAHFLPVGVLGRIGRTAVTGVTARSKIHVDVFYMMVFCRIWIWKRVARVNESSSAASQILWCVPWGRGPTVLFFSWDFFWRWGRLEYWIRSYDRRGHRYCFICPFVVIDPTYLGATIVVAQAYLLTSIGLIFFA